VAHWTRAFPRPAPGGGAPLTRLSLYVPPERRAADAWVELRALVGPQVALYAEGDGEGAAAWWAEALGEDPAAHAAALRGLLGEG